MSEDTTRMLPSEDTKLILAQLQTLTGQVQALVTQVATLNERQAVLEDKVDRRMQETRPIWEAVLARLEKIESHLGNLEARMTELEAEQKELRRAFFGNVKEFMRMNN